MKMRQYEVGEAFVQAVTDLAGFRALDAAWSAPEHLPTLAELDAPGDLARARRRRRRRLSRPTAVTARTPDPARIGPHRPGRPPTSPGSPPRWWSRARAVRTPSRCSCSRPRPGSRRSRCTWTTGCGPTARPTSTSSARAAESLGVPWRSVRVAVGAGPNLEARARDARYGALQVAREELGATAILVAHTADDQAETVLLNVLRGSAAAGLAGMAPRRGTIVRPLLHLRRRRRARGRRPRAGSPRSRTRPTPTCAGAARGSGTRCCRCWARDRSATSSRCSRGRPTCSGPSPTCSTSSVTGC